MQFPSKRCILKPSLPQFAPFDRRSTTSLGEQNRKTWIGLRETFSPGAAFNAGLAAAITMAAPPKLYPREWRDGFAGFSHNLGDAVVTTLVADTTRFATATITHEDPRYFPDHSKNPLHRVAHALLFTVADRNEAGHRTVAVSIFAASLAAGFVGQAYLPAGYNDVTHSTQRSAGILVGSAPTLVIGFAKDNLNAEFRPELKRAWHKLLSPFHASWR